MYITETTDDVRKIFDIIGQFNDESRIKFLIYIFERLNNNQINSKNEVNPNLIEDDDMKILKFSSIGLNDSYCDLFLRYFINIYKIMNDSVNIVYDGNVQGIVYSNEEKRVISSFERLSFNEKLDVFREIFIRYDNDTYFYQKFTEITFSSTLSGFDIAKNILDFKSIDGV